jgi:hypothetical protein
MCWRSNWSVSVTWPPEAIEATWSHTGRMLSQPTSRPSIGCMVVADAPCDQMASIDPSWPVSIWFNAA